MKKHYFDVIGCKMCESIMAETKPGNTPFGPPHDASSRCESGKRNHCTCDTCF